MSETLRGIREGSYSVDDDRNEDCRRNGCPVFRILVSSDKFRVVRLEQDTERRENDNRKYRDNDAIGSQQDSPNVVC